VTEPCGTFNQIDNILTNENYQQAIENHRIRGHDPGHVLFDALGEGRQGEIAPIRRPAASHGYSARESILHMLWEQDRWLEKYVK
jgi:hypothetical protein